MPASPSPVPSDPSQLSHCHTCHVTHDPSQPIVPVAAHSTHPGLVRPFAGTCNHPPNILPLHLQFVHDMRPSIHNARPWSTQILRRYMHLSYIPIPYIRPVLCKCSFRLNINSASTLRLPISLTPIKLALAPRILVHTSISGLRTPLGLWALLQTLSCTLSSILSPFRATPVNP